MLTDDRPKEVVMMAEVVNPRPSFRRRMSMRRASGACDILCRIIIGATVAAIYGIVLWQMIEARNREMDDYALHHTPTLAPTHAPITPHLRLLPSRGGGGGGTTIIIISGNTGGGGSLGPGDGWLFGICLFGIIGGIVLVAILLALVGMD